ncbi:hypothetical protein [Arcicella sp. BE140]|nr:hypothetical protein [Arcicella sp. BE140]MDR6562808.1 hypothetical protein [Arcicella sp. BE51]MDR6824162.1 hypothetical protein [Arcicella sp. BE139]
MQYAPTFSNRGLCVAEHGVKPQLFAVVGVFHQQHKRQQLVNLIV